MAIKKNSRLKEKTIFSMIVAMDNKNGIGKNNLIPWYIPNDFKWFKKQTLNKTIVMGHKTWVSLKNKPLKNRTNIVLSRNKNLKIEGAILFNDFKQVLNLAETEICIIGGGEIYKLFYDYLEKIYLTRINFEFNADTFLSDLDLSTYKQTFVQKNHKQDGEKYDYCFEIYERNL